MADPIPTWDAMSVLEQMQCIYWDFYKDVFGVRPRWVSEAQWNDLAWLETELDNLQVCADRLADEEREWDEECARREQDLVQAESDRAEDDELQYLWYRYEA